LMVSPHDETASKASSEGYILQVGSFREQHRAEALLKAFSDKGFEVFVEKTALNDKGETSYRVRLGPYSQLSEAQQIVQEVFKESGHRPIILPNSINSDTDARSQIEPAL
jgi:cell division protein FtsN